MPSVDTASAILRALSALGVTHVLYCPGSRSAPFAYALESGAFGGQARPVLDERGAGFLAVGMARAGIVTSGTAVAELAPAVLEASHARLPLLAITADRPGELRGVGASQATDQSRLFATHARACISLEAQEPSVALAGQVSRAVAAAVGAPTGAPGPVQINVEFRDPLTPADAGARGEEKQPIRATRVSPSAPTPLRWEEAVGEASAGLIIAGEGASSRARLWSQASGFPLLSEPTSGAWAGGGVTPYEQSIVAGPLARDVDTVVVTGRPTLSRPIHALLARPDVRVVVVDQHAPWTDISGNASTVVADLAPPTRPCGAAAAWAARVREASELAGRRIGDLLAAGSGRTMIDLARAVARASDGPLVLGASNPVRAFDLAVPSLEGRAVHSNRGQAGIDGTVATSVGVALGSSSRSAGGGGRVTAVMGDLTLCHDASSLALAAATHSDLDIVLADDNGGGIFATLEHGAAASRDAYDRWFGLAQSVDYAALASAYGVSFARADTPEELSSILATPAPGPRLIHAPVERAAHLYGAIRDILC